MSHAIELDQVTKRFGDCLAVDRLDLVVPEGTIYGFIGPNGSGKTTTLRMILRILYPDGGRVVVLGCSRGAAANDRVGYLPEERGLYRKMRVRELLRFFAQLKGMRRCHREIDDWLERFDLARWADQKAETLSKGMSQKLQFIIAVVARPRLVVLDEPFSGLDPVNMDVLRDAVRSVHQDGTTVIFSTHDMDMAERLCDTIFMIFRGKKVLDGTLAAIQAQFGEDTIRLRTADPDVPLADLPGVVHVNDHRHYKELRIGRDADPRAILQELLGARRSSISSWPDPRCTTSSCGSPGPKTPLLTRCGMRKILIIATREYRALVGTKAFLIVLTLMPVLMGGGIVVQGLLAKRVNLDEKRIVVIDRTGKLFDALAKAADNRNQQAIFDLQTGKQLQPRYHLEPRPAGPVTDAQRVQLSQRVRQGEISAFVEIPPDVFAVPGEGGSKAVFYAQNLAFSQEKAWLQGAFTNAVRRQRLKEAKIDPDAVDRASAMVMVEGFGLFEQTAGGEVKAAEPKDQELAILLPFGIMMLMFMVVVMAAQPLIESVMEERLQRIAEVLLGSVSPWQLMAGKLLGIVAGSFTIVLAYGLGAGRWPCTTTWLTSCRCGCSPGSSSTRCSRCCCSARCSWR